MFEGIGRIGQYLQMKDLKLQAKTKIRTGQSLDQMREELKKNQTIGARMTTQKTKQADMTSGLRTSIIRQKLMRGRELSVDELKYLKDNDPDLYDKARRAQQTRTELQQALKRAKTKEEAQRAVAQAQLKVATEMQLENRYGSADGAMTNGSAAAGTATGMGEAATQSNNAAASMDDDLGADVKADGAISSPAQARAHGVEGAAEGAQDAYAESMRGTQDARGADAPKNADGKDAGKEGGAVDKEQEKQLSAEAKEQAKADALMAKKEALKQLAEQAKTANGSLPKEKFIFMLMAIMDEWKQFTNSKDYEEMPEKMRKDDEKTRVQSTKKPYRPTGMASIRTAEGYGNPDADGKPGGMLDITSISQL